MARRKNRRGAYEVSVAPGNIGVDGIILKWTFMKWDLDRSCSGYGQVEGARECGNQPSGSIKCGEFIDRLRVCKLLKKGSAPWSE